jgi:hypothetical protein
MTVQELIAKLQLEDPKAEVVQHEVTGDGYAKVREVLQVELRTYSRKGIVFFHGFDDEEPLESGTDVGSEKVSGVVLW